MYIRGKQKQLTIDQGQQDLILTLTAFQRTHGNRLRSAIRQKTGVHKSVGVPYPR